MNPLLLSLPLLLNAAPGVDAPAAESVSLRCEEHQDADVALDVEVLRRLLVQAVTEAMPEREDRSDVRYVFPEAGTTEMRTLNTLFSSTSKIGSVSHSRGYYMPGLGVVFSLDTTLPVVEVEPKPEPNGGHGEGDDAWRQMRREVLGGTDTTAYKLLGAVRSANQKEYAIDERAVRNVRDAVLRVLARHGSRIESLTGSESLVVALHIGPSAMPLTFTSTNAEGEESSQTYNVGWVSGYASLRADPVRLVVRIGRNDLGDGSVSFETVRDRAAVHSY